MKQKLIFTLVALLIVILLAQQMYSNYTANKCEDSQTFVSGYRCYTEDKKSFNQNVKKCVNCTTGVWATKN